MRLQTKGWLQYILGSLLSFIVVIFALPVPAYFIGFQLFGRKQGSVFVAYDFIVVPEDCLPWYFLGSAIACGLFGRLGHLLMLKGDMNIKAAERISRTVRRE